MKKPRIKHRPHLDHLRPYPAGKPIEEVQREYGLKLVDKLASNENPLGPSPKGVAAGKRALAGANFYPEGGAYYLRNALAGKLKIKSEQLIFGNGTDELIVLLAQTFSGPGDQMIVSDKSFVRYRMAAMQADADYKVVPMSFDEPAPGLIRWRHDLTAMARAIDKNTKMICLSNPNNPLGTLVERKELQAFLKRVPQRVLIVLDEAYFEYGGENAKYPDGLKFLAQHPNLFILRTFSKAYGLAGLRVGYGIAHPNLIDSIDRVRPPFNVDRVAQASALGALDDGEHLRRTLEVNREGAEFLMRELNDLGFRVIPTWANFLTFEVDDATTLAKNLLPLGMIVRPLTAWGMPTLIRTTIGRPAQNKRLIKALKKLLRGA